MFKGIDVSDNQKSIDWKKVKNAGVEFAILRSVRRSGKADYYLPNNIKGCIENDIPFDFYKYSYAVNEAEAIAEAKRVVEVVTELLAEHGIEPSTDITIWHDVEDAIQIALSTEKLTEIVQAFKKEIVSAGFNFGLYMGKYHFDKGEVNLPLLGETHVWIARYYDGYTTKGFAENPNEKYKPIVPNGELWGWQYTSSGRVDGISGNVDLNIAYYEIGKKTPVKPTEKPVQKVSDTKMLTIKKGSTGKAVKVWQAIVEAEIDGDFGSKTRTATIAFQQKVFPNDSSEWDGIVGDKTWKAGLKSLM